MDLDLADNFLSRFDYDLITLQVFPTSINGKVKWPRKGGKILATGEPGSTAIAFNGALKNQPFIKDLTLLQKQRMGVYFMVNEGDGELHGSKIVRNSKAVHALKSLFVDTDEGNPKKLKDFCRQKRLKPHMIVQSSPGKYHYYFLIEELPATQENIYNWQSCQQRLASLDSKYDSSMADIGKVLRVPGFYHTKKSPYLIKQVYESRHKPYSLTQLFETIEASKTPPKKGSRFERPSKILKLGARHEALSKYLGSLSNSLRDSDALCDAAIGFSQRHFQNPSDWLPTGSRYQELQDQISFVTQEREKEDLQNTLQSLETEVKQGFSKLPDEFYLKAPGIVGKMVREICHYSAQPYPSFAFAAACSLVGTLKAPLVRGEYRDTPPSTYFLCLTDTGRGKDFPREAIANVFVKLGFKSLLTQKFRSAQGFLKRLSKSKGIHLFLHDEAHHLFAQIKKAESDYVTALKPHLLSLFSSANAPIYDPGAVVTEKIEIAPIPYPTLNYCGFGLPTGFEDTFQSAELAEGLLTRFLVVRDYQKVQPISASTMKVPKHFKFEQDLKELGSKLRLMLETAILDEQTNTENAVVPMRQFVRIPMDAEALELWIAYSKRIAEARNSASSKIIDSLQSRLVEQVARLAVILADKYITKDIIQFCITFVDHCYANVAQHATSFDRGQGNKDLDKLVDFISERNRINQGPMQVQELRNFFITNRQSLENTIALAIKLQRVQELTHYRRPNVTKGPTSTAYLAIQSI